MRIAATRSFRIYGLEGSNPKFRVFLMRFESKSTEVDRGRDSVWAICCKTLPVKCGDKNKKTVFGPFLDAQKLAEAQNRTKMQVFRALSHGSGRRAQLQKIMDFLAEV